MGQYRLAFYLQLSVGFLITYLSKAYIIINIPFIEITIGLTDNARGIRFFRGIY